MENEPSKEVTKKKSGVPFTIFACIMTGIIVFFATTIGQELVKSKDTGGKSTNSSNSNSNSNSNATSNANGKLSDEEALSTAKSLYEKASSDYDHMMSGDTCTEKAGEYDCTNLYNDMKKVFASKHSFATMLSKEYTNLFDKFTEKDGKYYLGIGGIGPNFTCTTTLAVKSVEENKIVVTATTEQVPNKDLNEKTSTFTNDFEIIKEDGTWKVSKFNYIFANTLK